MIDMLIYLNTACWIIVGVVLLVGNLTYANYYTKINSTSMDNFWIVYIIVVGIALFNFLIAWTVDYISGVPSKLSASYYGMALLAGESVLVYFVVLCMLVISGFCKLKQYFGLKRNKI